MGPYGTRILGDMAADVIKVESPEGDSFRAYGPFRHKGMGGAMLHLHRNKRSIYLDLKQGSGQEALKRLIQRADALVHNLRPAAAQHLGPDWPSVSALNPRIVVCTARGFSQAGPHGDKAAYDDLIGRATCRPAKHRQLDGHHLHRHAPRAGEHTRGVLLEVGMSEDQVQALVDSQPT
jgi:crotonobetainyl-CoA:carnitine CoA-transferase CaiB-like acyl-CoA transferase